jgi:hypothetical protein
MQFQCSLLAVLLMTVPALSAGAGMPAGQGAGGDRMLNNEGLVVLARAGYNERFLAELIQSQPNRFDTSVEGLVYLAKQGISERIVRMVIAEQKAADRREAARAAGDYSDEPAGFDDQPAQAARKPVRMKVVKQKMLVPVSSSQQQQPPLGSNPLIVVEKRVFGDRYYAMPGAQAPITTPVATPRAPQTIPSATTHVVAFH